MAVSCCCATLVSCVSALVCHNDLKEAKHENIDAFSVSLVQAGLRVCHCMSGSARGRLGRLDHICGNLGEAIQSYVGNAARIGMLAKARSVQLLCSFPNFASANNPTGGCQNQ